MSIERCEPHLGPRPDYSRAFYPNPPSHDFCVWLIIAELMRRQHKPWRRLRVKLGLTDGQLGLREYGRTGVRAGVPNPCSMSRAYFDQMMLGVMQPAVAMIGAELEPPVYAPFDLDALSRYVEYDYHIGHLVDAGRAGARIPRWRSPAWARAWVDRFLRGRRPVVITLREADAQPERNSRIDDWLRFADRIGRAHGVIIVRDTERGAELLPWRPLCAEVCPEASWNAYIRLALYERALVNMMVCNGPNVWAIFSDAPYLIFKQLVPALPDWDHGQPKGWRDQDHMEVGDQYPWALPRQRLAWADDDYGSLCAAFDDFLEGYRA